MRDAGSGKRLESENPREASLCVNGLPEGFRIFLASLIPHPGSLKRHPNGDPDLVPDDDKQRVEPAQAAGHPDVVGAA